MTWIQGNRVEFKIPAHWNTIGHSMTALPSVLSQHLRWNVLCECSHKVPCPSGKIWRTFQNL